MIIVDTEKMAQGKAGIHSSRSNSFKGMAEESAIPMVTACDVPEPEVTTKATRRRFSAQYKLNILKEAEVCSELGSLGALLRREGLYSSYLDKWRSQRKRGTLAALAPKKRGRKEVVRNPLFEENEKLRKENGILAKRLKQAEIIIDIQKKISMILNIPEMQGEGGNG